MEILNFILFIIALINLNSLSQKVKEIEKKIEIKSQVPNFNPSFPSTPYTNQSPSIPKPPENYGIPSTPVNDKHFSFSDLLTRDGLLKVGALLVLLGVTSFLSLAFASNLIGPTGQITIGLLIGIITMLAGEWRTKSSSHQGNVLTILGLTIILLTIYAARTVYGFFDPISAALIMLLALVFSSASSLVRNDPIRLLITLIGAGIVPFLTDSPNSSSILLMGYLLLISIGLLWVLTKTGWRWLLFALSILYSLYSLVILTGIHTPNLLYLILIQSILLVGGSYILHLRLIVKSNLFELASTILTLFFGIIWIETLVSQDWKSLITTIIAAVIFIFAYGLYKYNKSRLIVFEYTGFALILLSVAAVFGLEGPILQMSFISLTVVSALLAQAITNNTKLAQGINLLLIPLGLYQTSNLLDSHKLNKFSAEALGLSILIALSAVSLGYYWYRKNNNEEIKNYGSFYMIGGILNFLLIFWKLLEFIIPSNSFANSLALILYTLGGLYIYVWSSQNNYKKASYTSLFVLGMVVLRLLTVEFWNNVLMSILVLVLIGILFITTAIIRKPKVHEV